MSDDIINRLRTRNGRPGGFGLGPVCDKAADEIERLTAALDCRTCSRYNVGECLSVWKCVDGSRYQQHGLVQLWAGPP